MFSLYARARSLIIPGTAGPDDAAIVIGPDLPPCMQAAYSSAIFFRPPSTVSASILHPIAFIAQPINPVSGQLDEGWAFWDQQRPATICGYIVTRIRITPLVNAGTGQVSLEEYWGVNAQVGSMSTPFNQKIVYGKSWGGSVFGTDVYFGDGGAATPPSAAGVFIDGTSLGRGLMVAASDTNSTAAIGAETVTLTTGTRTFFKGRAYQWVTNGSYNQSAAGFWIQNIRLNNLAGTLIGQTAENTPVASGPYRMTCGRFRVTSADQTFNLVQTMAFSGAGTVTVTANGISTRSLYCYDIGAANDYSGEPAL